MSRQHTNSRPKTWSIKVVIGAAAVATTLGGWAALAAKETAPVQAASQTAPAASAPPAWLLTPPPIPALPEVASLTADGAAGTAETRPAASAVAEAPLRVVSAPPAATRPAPITVTRSSR